MVCPPVRRDSPRVLASELSTIQADKHALSHLYNDTSVDLATLPGRYLILKV